MATITPPTAAERTYAIPYLCVCERRSDGSKLSPLWLTEFELLRARRFFEQVLVIYPHLLFFEREFYKLNSSLNIKWLRYFIQFCYKDVFTSDYLLRLPQAHITFLHVEGTVPENILQTLSTSTSLFIIACEDTEKAKIEALNRTVISHADVSTRTIYEAVEQNIAICKQRGVPGPPPILPPYEPATWDDFDFDLTERNVARALEDIGGGRGASLLLAQRRRSIIPVRAIETSSISDTLRIVERVADQKEVDNILISQNFPISSKHPQDLNAFAKVFLRTKLDADYLRLEEEVRVRSQANLDGLILYLPCVDKTRVDKEINLTYRSPRVRALLYSAWMGSSPQPSAIEALRTDVERIEANSLISAVRAELQFAQQCVAILSLHQQRASVCLPLVNSCLLRRVVYIRRLYAERSYATLNREMEMFGEDLAESLPAELLTHLRSGLLSLTVLSDLPIEWLRLDGIPLMFRTRISRFPITPSDALFNFVRSGSGSIVLDKNNAKKVLVLNCLAQDELKLQVYPKHLRENLVRSKTPHVYREVGDLDEYEAIIKEINPIILIHIGHGTFDDVTRQGAIFIGKNKYDLSARRLNTWMPPIVLLGACDTYSVSPAGSMGRAFLRLGARSVLGTMMSVNADRVVFLFLQVMMLLWAYLKPGHVNPFNGGQQTWGAVVLHALELSRRIDPIFDFNDWQQRHGRERCNVNTSLMVFASYDQRLAQSPNNALALYHLTSQIILEQLAVQGKQIASDFERFLSLGRHLPHVMFFTHLGSPESIFIQSNEDAPA